jgi:hypothetical protein
LGAKVSRLLAGAWRNAVDVSELTNDISEAELTEITPLLCESGAGALGWWKIRDTPLADTEAGRELHEVYRRFRLSALVHERELAHVFSRLRAEGIEAVLVKGWAIARRYPDRALRPYGDIDLCVAPHQFEPAERALAGLGNIDLHRGFSRIGQTRPVQSPRSKVQRQKIEDEWNELFARSQVVFLSEPGAVATGPLASSNVQRPMCNVRSAHTDMGPGTLEMALPLRILSDEDHLRVLCMHLLRSGARRPPWLCDVALLVEAVQNPSGGPTVRKDSAMVQTPSGSPTVRKDSAMVQTPDFDWDVCLGSDPVPANWVAVAIKLAHELLGANTGGQRAEGSRQTSASGVLKVQSQELPRWLAPAVLQQWGRQREVGSRQTAGGRRQSRSSVAQSPKSKVQRPKSNVQSPTSKVQSPKSKVQSPLSLNRPWTLDLALWTNLYGSWTNLFRRWDNPIRATAALGRRFNNWPRLPYRIAESIMRLPELPAHLRLLARGRLKWSSGFRSLTADARQVSDLPSPS